MLQVIGAVPDNIRVTTAVGLLLGLAVTTGLSAVLVLGARRQRRLAATLRSSQSCSARS